MLHLLHHLMYLYQVHSIKDPFYCSVACHSCWGAAQSARRMLTAWAQPKEKRPESVTSSDSDIVPHMGKVIGPLTIPLLWHRKWILLKWIELVSQWLWTRSICFIESMFACGVSPHDRTLQDDNPQSIFSCLNHQRIYLYHVLYLHCTKFETHKTTDDHGFEQVLVY